MTILFLLFFALPSDPAELLAGGRTGPRTLTVVEAIEEKYGLDDPIYVQYGKYLWSIAQFDFGESYKTKESVNDTIQRTAARTACGSAFWAVAIETVIGISFGVLSARRRNSFIDSFTTTTAVIAGAIPGVRARVPPETDHRRLRVPARLAVVGAAADPGHRSRTPGGRS